MEKKNNNGVLIGLLLGIIVMLLIFVALFATNTISFKSKETTIDNQNSTEKESTTKKDIEDTEKNKDIYSPIIEEYKRAISNKNNDNNYKYVNDNAINKYFNQKGTEYELSFKYAFYDINKDGNYEMLINNEIIDIFSYDGTNIIRLFEENSNCLAESRCSITLYNDGTIYFSGSGGASHRYISFYSINQNISTLNTINAYYLEYNSDGKVTIYDEKEYDPNTNTGTKSNYNSEQDLESANVHDKTKIELEKLDWQEIK